MIKLGVNIDHIATLREARYPTTIFKDKFQEPNPTLFAQKAIENGANSVTIHLREDRRHIQDHDVFEICNKYTTNLELALTKEIVNIAVKAKPNYACIVPENRREISTEGGLDFISTYKKTNQIVKKLIENGTKVSLFIDPDQKQIEKVINSNCKIIELHTGKFANLFNDRNDMFKIELENLRKASQFANENQIIVNAGHGLNQDNLPIFLENVPYLNELNIGHHIIASSLINGFGNTVKIIKKIITKYS